MSESKNVLYHVCNDYSLERVKDDEKQPNRGAYRERAVTVDGQQCIQLIHIKYDELHYLEAPAGWDGREL